MENRKRIIIIAIFLVLSLCVTVVATVAFFNYAKEGSTDNVIETGTIEFRYDEVSKRGNGIELIDALPVASNDTEKTNNTYFEFNITAKTMSLPISYVVTAKKSVDSDDMDDLVDLYLSDDSDNQLFDGVHKYSNLVQYRNKPATEKVIYTDTVPANQSNFRKDFRLRMWIDESVDFSGKAVTKYFCNGTEVALDSEEYNNCSVNDLTQTVETEYKYNNKMFKITVNVYTDDNLDGYVVLAPLPEDALVTHINTLATTDTTNIKTDDPDHNPRFVGTNPSNYVYFNCSTTDKDLMNDTTCEKWRIIGVFDRHIKIIRSEPLDTNKAYSWDSSPNNINTGYGVNYWPEADLMRELNGDYLNSDLAEDTMWYSSTYENRTATFDHTKVLKAGAQEMIAEVTWNLGSALYDGITVGGNDSIASDMYVNERRTDVIPVIDPGSNTSNDGYERVTTWTGKVGLMYPTDYMYASSGNDTLTREHCLSTTYWWGNDFDCGRTDWLNILQKKDWTISAKPTSGRNLYVITVGQGLGSQSAAYPSGNLTRPVVFLKSEVRLTGGNGAADEPYTLGM